MAVGAAINGPGSRGLHDQSHQRFQEKRKRQTALQNSGTYDGKHRAKSKLCIHLRTRAPTAAYGGGHVGLIFANLPSTKQGAYDACFVCVLLRRDAERGFSLGMLSVSF